MAPLTRYEQETIILFNEEENTARIETFNGRLLRQIEHAQKNCPEIICEEKTDGYGVYIVPKKTIKIHAPIKFSEETKKKHLENLMKIRETKKAKDFDTPQNANLA